MVDRPILRFPDPAPSERHKGSPKTPPRPGGPGRDRQGQRFQDTFDRLADALDADDPEVVLRADPAGIAPERALVFVTAGSVTNFARAAAAIDLEVFAETDLEPIEDFPDRFEPVSDAETLSRTLYATMPTLAVFRRILSLWNAHQNGEKAPTGAAPWWAAFDLLLELRPWGPEDRLTESARTVIEDRLPLNGDEQVSIELEIWPAASAARRAGWRAEAEDRIDALGGIVLDRASIAEDGFTYEALLAGLPAHAVRTMLADPAGMNGLATLEGVQFVLPQTIGQATPGDPDGETADHQPPDGFAADAPIRVALFDGTPAAAHDALNGGVVIEDIHDLVPLSPVNQRHHATAMASLILRGDLDADGSALEDARLVSVPLLIDSEHGAWTPENRLFVDMLHTALARLMTGDDPLAPDVFVVNFSIGVKDSRFAGRITALARLIDWWAAREGVLFVISAGNIGDALPLDGMTTADFEQADIEHRCGAVLAALQSSAYERTLLSPAEAMNGVTVGAVSKDFVDNAPPDSAGILALDIGDDTRPQFTTALGLGLHRTIKPDLLEAGGRQEVRVLPQGAGTVLRAVDPSQRTGLVVAAPQGGANATRKSRGTSPAAALTTRAILQSVAVLTGEDGPYEGQELPRQTIALLSRALAVNAARWPRDAGNLYNDEIARLGPYQHVRAKEEVCRHFGYGVIDAARMRESPETGVTMIGHGSVRKDQAQIFRMPLPISIAGERAPRTMRTTLAWFSPVNAARAAYRLAGLEAAIAEDIDDDEDKQWRLNLKSDGPDARMINRGSVWSKRMIHRIQTVPDFDDGDDIPICVQCRDTASGGLSQDDDIAFAIAVTLEIEADVQYDIYHDVEQQIRLRLRGGIS